MYLAIALNLVFFVCSEISYTQMIDGYIWQAKEIVNDVVLEWYSVWR